MQIIKNDPVERKIEGKAVEMAVPEELPETEKSPVGAQFMETAAENAVTAEKPSDIAAPADSDTAEASSTGFAGPPSPEGKAEEAPTEQPEAEDEVAEAEAPAAEDEVAIAPAAPAPLSNAAVTAHTASLWKYLPLPADEPENSPQTAMDYQEFANGRLIAARVRGKKHKHEGTNCDDWMEVAHGGEQGDIAMLIVSDGAGSKHYSRIGSRESCQGAMSYLKRGLAELEAKTDSLKFKLGQSFDNLEFLAAADKLVRLVQQSVLAGREAVVRAFEARKSDEAYQKPLGRELVLQDFAATLLVTLVIPVPRLKEQFIVSCQVGDGMIAALDTKGDFATALRLLGEADSGEFSGETDFLTSSKMTELTELQRRTKVSRCSADLVLAMTDGVSDDYDPAKPELYGLYFDLLANNVLTDEPFSAAGLSAEQAALLRRTPAPVSYPWVNSPSVQVALQYEEKILEAMELSTEELWEQQEILRYASVGVSIKAEDRPEAKLLQWLDNYTRRGSFDDRTLALLQLRKKS